MSKNRKIIEEALISSSKEILDVNNIENGSELFAPHWRIENKGQIFSEKIICDSRHLKSSKPSLFEVDLTSTIGGWGGEGVYKEPIRICDNLAITKTVWHLINNLLEVHNNSSTIRAVIATRLNEIKRIYSYLFRNGIYQLCQVTPEIIDKLIEDYRENNGWWNLLDYDGAFTKMFDMAKINSFAASETCSVDRSKGFSFRQGVVDKYLGLPIGGYKPLDWIEKFRNKFYPNEKINAKESRTVGISESNSLALYRGLNILYFNAKGVDSIPFLPAFSLQQFNKRFKIAHNSDARTSNITPEYAVDLIKLCYDWIYRKAPHVISLLQTARIQAEHLVDRESGQKIKNANNLLSEAVQELYSAIREVAGFDWDQLGVMQHSGADISLRDLVKIVQLACFNMIGINHGRRKNEILGSDDLPYGLYLGCVTDIEPDLGLRSIRIYIEKTVKDWCELAANKLVFDAVDVLEKIYQLHRPLFTDPISKCSDHSKNERHKLFTIRGQYAINAWAESHNWLSKAQSINYKVSASLFFNLLKDPPAKLVNKSHPNRRLFACLYYYRFEFAELGAISNHLCHTNSLMTNIYLNDPDTRGLGESMQVLWGREMEYNKKIDDEEKFKYFEFTIKQILSGEKVGGYFPLLVNKRMKTLSKNVAFKKLSKSEKASELARKLSTKGYSPDPKANGVCMVGKNRRTVGLSKCFDNEINPQEASPGVCYGCIHLFTNDNYIRVMTQEVDELQIQSKDFRLPSHVRKQAKAQSIELINIITETIIN